MTNTVTLSGCNIYILTYIKLMVIQILLNNMEDGSTYKVINLHIII